MLTTPGCDEAKGGAGDLWGRAGGKDTAWNAAPGLLNRCVAPHAPKTLHLLSQAQQHAVSGVPSDANPLLSMLLRLALFGSGASDKDSSGAAAGGAETTPLAEGTATATTASGGGGGTRRATSPDGVLGTGSGRGSDRRSLLGAAHGGAPPKCVEALHWGTQTKVRRRWGRIQPRVRRAPRVPLAVMSSSNSAASS